MYLFIFYHWSMKTVIVGVHAVFLSFPAQVIFYNMLSIVTDTSYFTLCSHSITKHVHIKVKEAIIVGKCQFLVFFSLSSDHLVSVLSKFQCFTWISDERETLLEAGNRWSFLNLSLMMLYLDHILLYFIDRCSFLISFVEIIHYFSVT